MTHYFQVSNITVNEEYLQVFFQLSLIVFITLQKKKLFSLTADIKERTLWVVSNLEQGKTMIWFSDSPRVSGVDSAMYVCLWRVFIFSDPVENFFENVSLKKNLSHQKYVLFDGDNDVKMSKCRVEKCVTSWKMYVINQGVFYYMPWPTIKTKDLFIPK